MVKLNVPSKGDIWLINPDPPNGNELKGSHYFIVITESALNKSLGVSICCPISTVATSARSAGVTVSISGDSTKKGTVRGVVLCHQVRALDLKNRNAKFHTKAEPHLIDEVIMKLVDIIDPQP